MTKTQKWTYVTTSLLTVTIVSGYVVSRFAPKVGATIALWNFNRALYFFAEFANSNIER